MGFKGFLKLRPEDEVSGKKDEPWEESGWGQGVRDQSFPAKGTIIGQSSGDQEVKRFV